MNSEQDNMKTTQSLFDEPVDLFHFNQIQHTQSPSLYTNMHSVHTSRRSSYVDNEVELLFNTKLLLNESRTPYSMNTLNNQPPRSSATHISIESEVPHFNTSLATRELTQSEIFPPLTGIASDSHKAWLFSNEDTSYPYGWTQGVNHRLIQSNQKDILCPHYQQYGVCPRIKHCPYTHSVDMTSSFPSSAVKTNGSSLYQQYNMLNTSQPFFLPPSPPMSHLNNNKKNRPVNHRRSVETESNRFNNARVDDYKGKLYELCKDQNGCRFLQKKIEEKDNHHSLQLIFQEIYPHFTELMTDPFGNYLCQKMLGRCNDEQRTVIVGIVSSELVRLALNMHGTRAVQKLIEYLSTPEQIQIVTSSFNSNVVTLIKDLNGNHVIQKCLNRLSSEDNQFIYDAVCANCIEVASHKHGCCVLQRCFDHATISQKDQLVKEIAHHALTLVQNPFGNYVVQYILELGIPKYSESVILRFVDHVCLLSVQKFSSNVIEKCIRSATPSTRRLLIKELINGEVMEKLLHDSFANYVVQTSLDCADEDQRAELVECIRPLLPTIRTTPYGKRIHGKIFRDQKSTQSPRHKHRPVHDE